ncbi:MAG: glycosyltransferase family 4 protein [Bacteroidota bacterium]
MSNRPKKLIVGITAPPSVDLLIGQLSYFQAQGFDTYLLAPDHERVRAYCEKEGVPLIPVDIERNLSPLKDIVTVLALVHIFRRHRPDIINLGTPKISLLGLIAGFFTRVPLRIYTCRGLRFERESGNFRALLKILEKVTAACAHKVFCISSSLRDFGIREKVFRPEKATLIGHGSSNGVNLERFSPTAVKVAEAAKLKAQYGLEGHFTFGFVGRLTDIKGISELYKAFAALHEQYHNIRFLVIGRPIWDHIKDPSVIQKMEDHPAIIMVGFQPITKVPKFMKIMDCFVVPTRGEGFGNVYIEAAGMGLPIIGTDVTGCRDAVSNGYNGILVKPKDADSLKAAMEELYLNKEKRITLGENGLEWSKNFHPEIIWKGYVKLFEEPIK